MKEPLEGWTGARGGRAARSYPERYLVRRFGGLTTEYDVAEWLNEVAAYGYRLTRTSAAADAIWVFVEHDRPLFEEGPPVERTSAAEEESPARSVQWIRKN